MLYNKVMANQLSTSTSEAGTQTSTQSPQTSTLANNFGGQQSEQVQPGTAQNVLTSQNGIPLHATQLSTVSLAKPVSSQTPAAPTVARHIHPELFIFSGLLLIIAVVLFWTASRSTKNTTI